jgi:hypothetical protein
MNAWIGVFIDVLIMGQIIFAIFITNTSLLLGVKSLVEIYTVGGKDFFTYGSLEAFLRGVHVIMVGVYAVMTPQMTVLCLLSLWRCFGYDFEVKMDSSFSYYHFGGDLEVILRSKRGVIIAVKVWF